MRTSRWIASLLLGTLCSAAFAADTPSLAERRRLIQLRGREPGQNTAFLNIPKAPGRAFDAGGWVTAASLDLRDDDRQATTPDSTHTLLFPNWRPTGASTRSENAFLSIPVESLGIRKEMDAVFGPIAFFDFANQNQLFGDI